MVLFWITLLIALIGSNADGELSILYTPESLAFVRTVDTWESHLKEIFSAALGLSVEYYTEWKGLYVLDPFATPEAVLEVHVDGVRSLIECSEPKTKIFQLIADENEPHTFKGLQQRIKQHFGDGRNKVVNVKLFSDTRVNVIRRAFGSSNDKDDKDDKDVKDDKDDKADKANKPNRPIKIKYLKAKVEEDEQFLDELQTLQTIIEKVRDGAITPDNLIDFYHLRYRTLHVLADFYGPTSAQTKEARRLLGDALKELSNVFVKAYDGSVLVTVVTTDVAHARRSARSVMTPPSSRRWPYQWLELPHDWRKISLISNKIPERRQQENDPPQNDPPKEGPPKDEPPKDEPPKEGPPKEEPPKGEPPKVEPPKVEPPKEEKPKEDPPKDEKKPPTTTSTTTRRPRNRDRIIAKDVSEQTLMHEIERPPVKYYNPPIQDSYVMFNIFLWFGVSLTFAMLAIVYACMEMDPGRNTIIYRLTTMRTTMKND